MYDREIRWPVLIPLSLFMGLCILVVESFGVWGGFAARPDWFWALAFVASLRALPVPSICVFAWCGLASDMLLGSRPGAASIAFVAMGWVTLYWKPLASSRGWPGQAVAAGAGGFLSALLRHLFEAGKLAPWLWDRIFFVSLGDGLLTSLLFIPMALVLSLAPFRPWRERSGMFV